MTSEEIIKELERLPQEEVNRVASYFADIEASHDREADSRDCSMEDGSVHGLSHDEVFGTLRHKRTS
jgi:hypothetical protein